MSEYPATWLRNQRGSIVRTAAAIVKREHGRVMIIYQERVQGKLVPITRWVSPAEVKE